MSYIHHLEMEVRDYELDLQGIVNNSVYQNYLEHARHSCIKEIGVDFDLLHQRGVDPVVVRIEIDYKNSLRSGDRFEVRTSMQAMGRLRFVFSQEIVRLPKQETCIVAQVIAATLVNGRPGPCPEIIEAWNNHLLQKEQAAAL